MDNASCRQTESHLSRLELVCKEAILLLSLFLLHLLLLLIILLFLLLVSKNFSIDVSISKLALAHSKYQQDQICCKYDINRIPRFFSRHCTCMFRFHCVNSVDSTHILMISMIDVFFHIFSRIVGVGSIHTPLLETSGDLLRDLVG